MDLVDFSSSWFFFPFLFSLLPNEPQPTSASGSTSGMSTFADSSTGSTKVAFLPFFLAFCVPNAPQSSSGGASLDSTVGAGGTEVASSWSPFLPFFFSFLVAAEPHVGHESSALAAGSSTAVPISVFSGSTVKSSKVFFFLFFLAFPPAAAKPPHSPVSAFLPVSSSFASSSAPSPKSKPAVVVFLLFLPAPKDHIPLSPPSNEVSLVSLDLSVSALPKPHLLVELPQLPAQLPSPPNELPVSLVPSDSKFSSSEGPFPPRSMSCNWPMGVVSAGSDSVTGSKT